MKILFLTATILLFTILTDAQQTKTIKLNGGDVFDIPEVGALIVKNDDAASVQFIMPSSNRPKGYENVDLKENDKILMANGKKINDIKELKEIYEKLKTGEEFKLGIKRDEQMMIVRIKKADPESLPKRKMIVMNGGNEESVLLAGQGVLISKKGDKTIVKTIIDYERPAVKNSGLKENDVVISLNGAEIKSFAQFKKNYDNIKTGGNVEVKFSGRKMILFTKEDDSGLKIIKKEVK